MDWSRQAGRRGRLAEGVQSLLCAYDESGIVGTGSDFATIEWYVGLELVFGELSEIRWLR